MSIIKMLIASIGDEYYELYPGDAGALLEISQRAVACKCEQVGGKYVYVPKAPDEQVPLVSKIEVADYLPPYRAGGFGTIAVDDGSSAAEPATEAKAPPITPDEIPF